MMGGWLCWHDRTLILKPTQHDRDIPIARDIDDLSQVGFAVGRQWQISLNSDTAPTFLISETGEAWDRIPGPELHDPVQPAFAALFPSALRIAVVERARLHYLDTSDGCTWQTLNLPEGADWVGTAEGVWWAVGSQPSRRIRTSEREAAAWWLDERERQWHPFSLVLRWRDALHTLRHGGFEQLRAVAAGDPLVFASECAWFLDDPSWFLFTQLPNGKFAAQRLPGQALARLERTAQGDAIAFSDDGELWVWQRQSWQAQNIAPRLREQLNMKTIPHRVHLTTSGANFWGVVTLFSADQTTQRAAIRSDDGGLSWQFEDVNPLTPIAAWAREQS